MNYAKKNWRTKRAEGKRKSFMPNYDVAISEPRFEIMKPDTCRKKFGRMVGQGIFTYSIPDRERDWRSGEIEIRLPIVACWSSPFDGEVVKAHMTVFKPEVDLLGINFNEAWLFYNAMLKAGQALINRQNMTMTASSQRMLRYGKPAKQPYVSTDSIDGVYVNRTFYDSKAFAIADILNEIKRKGQKNIGGISTASFGNVPDELLQQVGFFRIPDNMGNSVPMWAGDPAILKDIEFDATYNTNTKIKFEAQLDTFLSGLQKALQS